MYKIVYFNLIDYQMHNLEKMNGKTYNVGGGRKVSASLKEMTAICERITGNKIEISKVLAFGKPGDQLIINPVHQEDWKAKKILKLIQ